MRSALHQRELVGAVVDKARSRRPCSGTHLVHKDVVLGRRLHGAHHGEIEELLDGLYCGTRSQRDAGSVKKHFIVKSGKMLARVEHDQSFVSHSMVAAGNVFTRLRLVPGAWPGSRYRRSPAILQPG